MRISDFVNSHCEAEGFKGDGGIVVQRMLTVKMMILVINQPGTETYENAV